VLLTNLLPPSAGRNIKMEAEVSSETLGNTSRLDVVTDRKTSVFISTAVRIKRS
jgi:hypothetical protein